MHTQHSPLLRIAAITVAFVPALPTLAAEPTWITATGDGCPIFRKEFTLPAAPKKAVVKIVGLGHFQMSVNGKPAGDAALHQPWSQYDKTIYFEELDVTPLLQAGGNAIGVMLGNSFWVNRPAPGRYHKGGAETDYGTQYLLFVDATIEMPDKTKLQVVSDASWRTTVGPVTFSNVYGGEDYDARLMQAGWDAAGYDDAAWKPVVPTSQPAGAATQPATSTQPAGAATQPTPGTQPAAPAVTLAKQHWPPVRAKEVFPAKQFVEGAPGIVHAFFGQNASGMLRFTALGKAGQSFTVETSEYRGDKGEYLKPRWGTPSFKYTLRGGEPESHQWLFHYEGFQGVEIKGAVPAGQANPNGLPVIQELALVHTRTDLPIAGEFRTSSEIFNGTHALVDWAMRSNASYVMTDCPHREKLGWLECAYLLAPTFSYRYDCREWFAKIARDIREAQEPSGRILTVAPSYAGTRFPGAFHWTVEWGAAGVLLPWHHYTWYGDEAILRDNYECMRRFVDYVASTSKDGIAPAGLGDWYDYGHGKPPGPSRFTPTDLTATAVQVMCIDAVIGAAEVLKKPDIKKYRELRAKTAAAFLKKFYDPKTKTFTNTGSCQCAHTIALAAGLVPNRDKKDVLNAVVADLEKRGWQQTPGDIGHVFFIRALAEAGRSDVLHKVYSRDGLGSYGGILKKGLTAMPETWDAMNDGYQSHNHCMLGHVMEWFYGYVAGIRQPRGAVGWKRVLIAPVPGPLEHAEATFNSPSGPIASKWTVKDGRFRLEASIPKGVSGELVLPDDTHTLVASGEHKLECAYTPPTK